MTGWQDEPEPEFYKQVSGARETPPAAAVAAADALTSLAVMNCMWSPDQRRKPSLSRAGYCTISLLYYETREGGENIQQWKYHNDN